MEGGSRDDEGNKCGTGEKIEYSTLESFKKFGVVGYHELFENKKPQINADER